MKLPALSAFEASGKEDNGPYKRWFAKLAKHTDLIHWRPREKLLKFELHLSSKAESICDV